MKNSSERSKKNEKEETDAQSAQRVGNFVDPTEEQLSLSDDE